jgi:2',3'-cyclic-nucleotide 2'-phosphodiesterase (5'-nucleotidase family)
MPYLDRICTIDITGEELKKIVGTVQSVGKSYYPSSSLKQTINIDDLGNKNVTKIEIYVNDEPIPIEDERVYKMASSMYVLSETSGEDFAKGESFKIIHEKAINHEIKCSDRTMDDEMAEFFKGRGTIDLSSKFNPEKPRIIEIIE